MKRKIPSDTAYFHYYNANPKGKHTGDCAIRAVSLALEQSYRDTLMEMAELSCKTGYAIDSRELINKYLKKKGFVKQKQPRHDNGKKFTGKQFCFSLKQELAIVSIGAQHLSCVKHGKVWDIWDCSNKCVGSYWIKDNGKI